MKKKIQKYLAGEREGFSLVELIIVIAIMAILIGVIALAVIPNIQRSRESKDLQMLDNILASANIAIANNKITGSGSFKLEDGSLSGDAAKVNSAIVAELGTGIAGKLGSTNASGKNINVSWTAATPSAAAKITVKVNANGDNAAAVTCQYTKNDAGSDQPFEVTN